MGIAVADNSVAATEHRPEAGATSGAYAPFEAPVTIAGCSAGAAWQSYVAGARGATLWHEPVWSRVVAETFGHAERHLLARRGARVVGVLPLVEVNSVLGGRLLISVPYGTYGGILADDAAARDALATAAAALAAQRGARVVELRSAEAGVPGWQPFQRYDGYVRALPGSVAELDAFLPKRARAAARQARDRGGLAVRHDAEQLATVWALYARSMRRLGSINYPLRFLSELVARLGARAWVSVAWQGRRAVAGTLSLIYGDTVAPYILGLDERVACPGAANCLYRAVMERAIAAGLRRFDYGRTRKDNPGSAGFKKNQGFVPRTLGYQRYVPAGRRAPDLTPSCPRFAVARRVWRHLPLPVTKHLGGWLAKSLPG